MAPTARKSGAAGVRGKKAGTWQQRCVSVYVGLYLRLKRPNTCGEKKKQRLKKKRGKVCMSWGLEGDEEENL